MRFCTRCIDLSLSLRFQIRIIADTSPKTEEDGKMSKKKKKPHRGYAFIVYEREKDMKSIDPLPFVLLKRYLKKETDTRASPRFSCLQRDGRYPR